MKTKKKQLIYACLMTLSGIAVAAIPIPQDSRWIYPHAQESVSKTSFTIPQIMPPTDFVSQPSKTMPAPSFVNLAWSDLVTETIPLDALDYYQPSVMVLNLSGVFPEGADTSDRLNSLAGEIFKELSLKDSQWLTNIYLFPNHTPKALAEGLGLLPEQVLGKYNPKDKAHDPKNPDTWTVNTWESTRITFHDGDGNVINGYSNVKELMSMGSVYTFYKGMEDMALFQDYVNALWDKSHDYSVHMSDVYYCDGCISEEEYQNLQHVLPQDSQPETAASEGSQPQISSVDGSLAGQDMASVSLEGFTESSSPVTAAAENNGGETPSDTVAETMAPDTEELFQDIEGPGREAMMSEAAEQATATQSTGSLPESTMITSNKGYCPGHVDMSVDVTIIGFDGNRNLFMIDEAHQSPDTPAEKPDLTASSETASKRLWTGWDTYNQNYAKCMNFQDWYQLYGLTVSSFISISNPLSESEIQSYLKALPNDISDTRRQVVEFALRSVGKVPYYWGGKPYKAGYDSNDFGSVIRADEDGRVLRGLDCSGWINWVYWSATGSRLPYESTSGLVTCGTAVSRENLQPGDIIVRLGEMPHVVMFLSWTGDGQMRAIHESSDSNNVTVGTMTADWNHYRKLAD